MRFLVLLIILFIAFGVQAQTISPVIQQCAGKKCEGEFSVRNNSVGPLFVVLDTKSFSLNSDAAPKLRPLDSTANVTLSESSSRISPMAEHRFGFKLECPEDCAIQIFSTMVAGR